MTTDPSKYKLPTGPNAPKTRADLERALGGDAKAYQDPYVKWMLEMLPDTAPTIYATLLASRDNPDAGPTSPAEEGSWTWWRTGPHPQGVWQAMDWTQPEFNKAYLQNRAEFPIHQDDALGPPSDFGNRVCHACNYMSEGYPEAGHFTNCDGICRRSNCRTHTSPKESEPTRMTPLTQDERATLEDVHRQLTWAAKALKDPGPDPRSQDFWDAQAVVAQSARKLKGLLDL
jgi:hypothetical protein